MDKDKMKNRISMALKDPILQQGFEIICKENAELKEKLKPENCLKSLAKSGLVKFTCENGNEHDQLTKAKEIIKSLLRLWNDVMTEETVKALIAEAEQFLKEE